MPDWEHMLREELGEMRLEPAAQDAIIAELAGHLEDAYERLLAEGVGADEAERRIRAEFPNGRELARKIRNAKQGEAEMKDQTKQVWVPGLVTTGLATLSLTVLHFVGVRQMVLWSPSESPALFYIPWLLSLPVLGFVGAYWSLRVGGRTSACIMAGVFPSLFYLAFPYLTLPLALIVDRGLGPVMAALGWFVFVSKWYVLNWVVLPCVALLAGALPAAIIAQSGRGVTATPASR
jgi:hypothetical protein